MQADLPVHEIERLLATVTGLPRHGLGGSLALTPDQQQRFDRLVGERRAGAPLQYLEATIPFGPIELRVDARALIPRPETELLWEQAMAALGEAGPGTVIVDLCTGSGALALALKAAFPEAKVYATDISSEALDLARENAASTGLDVEFHHGDLFAALPGELEGRVDLLVANPPYVAEGDWAVLPAEVRDHEPATALLAGSTGLEVIERIAADAYWWLGVGGWIFCEIGETQGAAALERFGAWFDVDLRRDLAGRDRILVARKGARCCV